MKKPNEETQVPTTAAKRSWKKMELSYLGNASELIQGGQGKLSPAGADPGDVRKQVPSG